MVEWPTPPTPLSQAFGVGALEEEDVEDHVYGEESMTSYDVTLAGEGDVEMERKFGWTGGIEGHQPTSYFHLIHSLLFFALRFLEPQIIHQGNQTSRQD